MLLNHHDVPTNTKVGQLVPLVYLQNNNNNNNVRPITAVNTKQGKQSVASMLQKYPPISSLYTIYKHVCGVKHSSSSFKIVFSVQRFPQQTASNLSLKKKGKLKIFMRAVRRRAAGSRCHSHFGSLIGSTPSLHVFFFFFSTSFDPLSPSGPIKVT